MWCDQAALPGVTQPGIAAEGFVVVGKPVIASPAATLPPLPPVAIPPFQINEGKYFGATVRLVQIAARRLLQQLRFILVDASRVASRPPQHEGTEAKVTERNLFFRSSTIFSPMLKPPWPWTCRP
jgi:hypothetical protein